MDPSGIEPESFPCKGNILPLKDGPLEPYQIQWSIKAIPFSKP
jgi:hypothetical protein